MRTYFFPLVYLLAIVSLCSGCHRYRTHVDDCICQYQFSKGFESILAKSYPGTVFSVRSIEEIDNDRIAVFFDITGLPPHTSCRFICPNTGDEMQRIFEASFVTDSDGDLLFSGEKRDLLFVAPKNPGFELTWYLLCENEQCRMKTTAIFQPIMKIMPDGRCAEIKKYETMGNVTELHLSGFKPNSKVYFSLRVGNENPKPHHITTDDSGMGFIPIRLIPWKKKVFPVFLCIPGDSGQDVIELSFTWDARKTLPAWNSKEHKEDLEGNAHKESPLILIPKNHKDCITTKDLITYNWK